MSSWDYSYPWSWVCATSIVLIHGAKRLRLPQDFVCIPKDPEKAKANVTIEYCKDIWPIFEEHKGFYLIPEEAIREILWEDKKSGAYFLFSREDELNHWYIGRSGSRNEPSHWPFGKMINAVMSRTVCSRH